MANYPQNTLFFVSVNNGYSPGEEGPRAVPLEMDFSTETTYYVDLAKFQSEGKIGQIQSIYVDNSLNPDALVLVVRQTGQRLEFPAFSCNTQPVFSGHAFQGDFTTTGGGGVVVKAQLLNVPLAPSQMGPITVNVSLSVTGSYTDNSGAIAAGGTSEPLFAANANRKGLIIQNPSSEVESLFINYGGAATIGQPSIEIPPGIIYEPTAVSTQAIEIIAFTTGHTFTAKELA